MAVPDDRETSSERRPSGQDRARTPGFLKRRRESPA